MNRIKFFREKIQMTQAELAQKVGVSQKAVAKWEVGKSHPRADRFVVLANTLHCSIDELFSEDSQV